LHVLGQEQLELVRSTGQYGQVRPVVERVVVDEAADRLLTIPRRGPVGRAWLRLAKDHVGSEDVCFFSGSYRDDYGYPNGLMLARNVQRDFIRALDGAGVSDRAWLNAVEKHPSGRDVLHCHGLVGGMSEADMRLWEDYWTTSRGWSKAVRCHDGGVAYVCKYALKGQSVELFDWST
jgi:hypothetical protein